MIRTSFCTILIFILTSTLAAQDEGPRWKRTTPTKQLDLQLFHSPHAINLPTAETLQKGDLEVEISHRFIPPLSDGADVFYGLDGPINNRLAIAYAPSNRIVMAIGRSNNYDNLDFLIKHKTLQFRSATFPVLIGLVAGAAWNMNVLESGLFERDKGDSKNFQFYGQIIANTLINHRFGIGVVLSHLDNSRFTGPTHYRSTTLGGYLQYYSMQRWNLLVEFNPTIDGYLIDSNPFAFGIELETGGHFFKIFVGNSTALNPSQYLAGADLSAEPDNWRLGFMITRLLKI